MNPPELRVKFPGVYTLSALVLTAFGFLLLGVIPLLGSLVLGASIWLAALAAEEDDDAFVRLVGWGCFLAALYLLI